MQQDYYLRQANVALRAYEQRGLAALQCLAGKNYDKLEEVLNKRIAAFHNFRVAIVLAEQAGFKPGSNLQLRTVWQNIVAVDEQLEQGLLKLKKALELDIHKTRNVRTKIGKYRTHNNQNAEFQKVI